MVDADRRGPVGPDAAAHAAGGRAGRAGRGGCRPAAPGRPHRRGPRLHLAISRRPRPRSTRCRPTATTTPRWCWRTSWKRRCATTTWRGRCGWQPATAAAMPEVSADGRCSRCASGRASSSRRPGLQGPPRELVAQDYVYAIKRFYDPRWNSSDLYLYESLKLPGLALRERPQDPPALRLRPRGRRPARAGPLHAAHHAGRARPALHLHAGRPGLHGCGGARGGGVLRRRHRRAPRGHRALPAEELAARLAHRARTFARLPRPALRRHAGRRPLAQRDRRAPGKGKTLPLVDEVVLDVVEERSRAGCRS
jgi:hypothetical protein